MERACRIGWESGCCRGVDEVGVETVVAEPLRIAGREALCEHPGTGAVTGLAEIVRRDRLEPTAADSALAMGARPRSRRTAAARLQCALAACGRGLAAASRMFDDGGAQQRVQPIRPRRANAWPKAELDASNRRHTGERRRRSASGPRNRRTPDPPGVALPARLRLAWDRLAADNMRVRRLTSDDGAALVGRALDAGQVRAARASFGLGDR